MRTHMILIFLLSLAGACRARLPYRGNENHSIYISPDTSMLNKIHIVTTASDCRCAGSVAVQKANLVDYMDSIGDAFSFSAYVNGGDEHTQCPLPTSQINKRAEPVIVNVARATLAHPVFNQGTVLARAMADFAASPYIVANANRIFSTDKFGGIMVLFENIELRPCKLIPWPLPWTYSREPRAGASRVEFGVNSSGSTEFTVDEIAALLSVVEQMTRQGIFRTKHQENLKDNTGSYWTVDAFSVDAVFIPHRFTAEFYSLLAPFVPTDIPPELYVPFVFEAMFDRNEWIYMEPATHNETLRIGSRALMDSCETGGKVNKSAAKSLYNFGFGACGGVVAEIEHVVVVVEEITGQSALSLGIALMVLGLMASVGAFVAFKFREIKSLCSACLWRLRGRHRYKKYEPCEAELVALDPEFVMTKENGIGSSESDDSTIHFE